MNGELAIRAAELSELAYSSSEDIAHEFRSEYEPFESGPVRGFVARDDNTVWTVYKGTDSKDLASWIVDLDAKKIRISYRDKTALVHRGFFNGFLSVNSQVQAAFQKMHRRGDVVVNCGHSQGAALTVNNTAFNFTGRDIRPWTMLYGCPRTFGTKTAKLFDEVHCNRTYRFVNNNDIVCRIPLGLTSWLHRYIPMLKFLPLGFGDVGQREYFDVTGKVREAIGRFELLKDRLAGRMLHLGTSWMSDGLEDHYIDRYVELVKGAFGK